MSVTRTQLWAITLVLAFFGWISTAQAQRPAVEETEQDINGIRLKGQRLLIRLDVKTVEKAWAGYLKEKAGGAVKGPSLLPTSKGQAKGIYTVEQGRIDSVTSNPVRILSKIEGTKEGAQVWWTLDMGNAYLSKKETPKEWAAAEAVLQKFARQLYVQDVQQQIADAEKVVVNTQSDTDKVMRQAEDIQNKIAKNQQKKLELEAALVANAKELEELNKDVEHNLKQQEAAKKEVEKMRHAVELVKGKMAIIE